MGTKQKVMVCSGGENTKGAYKKIHFVTMIIKQYLIVTFYVSFSYKKRPLLQFQ